MEIRILLKILYRRRAVIAAVLGLFVALAVLLLASAPKGYKAAAKVTVEEPDKIKAVTTGLGLDGLVLDTRFNSDVSMDTDIELLMVSPLVQQLIEEMRLCSKKGELLKPNDFIDGGFKSKLKGEASVSIEQYNDAALISIKAYSTDPSEAAEIANRLAALYIEKRIARSRSDFDEVKRALETSLVEIRDDYYSKLAEHTAFKQSTGIVDLDHTVTTLLDRIAELENNKAEQQRNIVALNETVAASRSELAMTEKLWESGEEHGESDLVTELKQRLSILSADLSALGTEVTSHHPDYKSLKAQLDTVEGLLKSEPELSISRKQFSLDPVYESLYVSITDNLVALKAAFARLEAVDKQVEEQKEKLMTLPALQTEQTKLSSDLSVKSSLYSTVLKYLMQVKLAETATVAKIRLIEPAQTPDSEKPSFPKKGVILALALILGSFFGVGAALVADYADDRIRDIRTLRRLADLPCFGYVPFCRTQRDLNLLKAGNLRVTEALRSVRDSLIFEAGNSCKAGGVIVVAAPKRGTGAGTIATGLAKVLVEKCQSVVFVNLNMRYPARREPAGAVGAADVLSGAELDAALTPSQFDGLSLMSAGAPVGDPGSLLQGGSLSGLLSVLRQRFKFVVISAPPVLLFNDAQAIAENSDCFILVASAASTPAPLFARCAEKLRSVRGSSCLLGTVLNAEGYSTAISDLPRLVARRALSPFRPRPAPRG